MARAGRGIATGTTGSGTIVKNSAVIVVKRRDGAATFQLQRDVAAPANPQTMTFKAMV